MKIQFVKKEKITVPPSTEAHTTSRGKKRNLAFDELILAVTKKCGEEYPNVGKGLHKIAERKLTKLKLVCCSDVTDVQVEAPGERTYKRKKVTKTCDFGIRASAKVDDNLNCKITYVNMKHTCNTVNVQRKYRIPSKFSSDRSSFAAPKSKDDLVTDSLSNIGNDIADLKEWLKAIHLEQYHQHLTEQGVDDMTFLLSYTNRATKRVDEETIKVDLELSNVMKPAHLKKFIRKIEDYCHGNLPFTTSV